MEIYLTMRNLYFQNSRFAETIANAKVHADVMLSKDHSMFKMFIV
jgi:hypothetical protein